MAKSKNTLVKLSGTLYDATFVDSKRYGRHVRSPRGTYKKATLNSVLKQNASRASVVNGTAKVIHDYIKSISGSFKLSDLWQEFLKRMRKVHSTVLADLLASVKGLEVNNNYPLSRFMHAPQAIATISNRKLCLELSFSAHPLFDRKLQLDSYYYTIHLLYINQQGEAVDTDGVETEWVNLQGPVPHYDLSFEVPVKARYYVLILEVAAGLNEVQLDVLPGKGMRVMEVGSVKI